MTKSDQTISSQITLSTLATISVSPGAVRKWLFNATDARIVRAEVQIQYAPGTTIPGSLTGVRGKFVLFLVEQVDNRRFEPVTQPKTITSMENGRFVLGDGIRRLVPGRMVFLQLEYSAVSAASGEPVFWQGAQALNITVQLDSGT